jgi:hypothetical protein
VKLIATGAPARAIPIGGFQVALCTANMEDEVVVRISRFSEKMVEADDRIPSRAPYALYCRTESGAQATPPLSKDFAVLTAGAAGKDRRADGQGLVTASFPLEP